MTRLGTPNQVDHLHHKGSPRHCVIHPNDCWLASRVKIHLAWQFQPNQTSFPNCTSIGGSLSSESRPGIHHVSWLQEEHREIWMDQKKTAFLTCWTSKNRRSPMFRWYFSDPMDRSQHHQVSRPSAEIKSCSRCCNCLADLYSCRLCHTEVGLSENLGENLQIWCLIIIDHNFSHIK